MMKITYNQNLLLTIKKIIFMKKLFYFTVVALLSLTACEKPFDPNNPSSIGSSGKANGHDYVDLGLPSGTKWATCNVGAESPEEYGDYFAWGETQPKDVYNWSNLKWYDGNEFTKYCTDSANGIVDNKTILELSDDAANANWGGDWRMPTKEEQDELRTKCTWTWTTKNGINGYTVTGPNGNSIFLPASGYRYGSDLNDAGVDGYGWSSSLYASSSMTAYFLVIGSNYVEGGDSSRCSGFCVRPVMP